MAETATLDPGLKELMREQVLDAEIAKLRETFQRQTPYIETVKADDSDVAGLVEGGKFTLTQSHEGRPVPKERITIYATENGEPREVLLYMLSKYLQRRHPDGTPVFSMVPTTPYITGKEMCFLHRQHPNRALLDSIGLANRYCNAANLASEFDARLHAQNRHPQSWRVYQEYEAKLEKEMDRQRWDALLRQQAGRAPEPTVPATVAPPAVETTTGSWTGAGEPVQRVDLRTLEPVGQAHLVCHCGFVAKNNFGLLAHKRGKHKE